MAGGGRWTGDSDWHGTIWGALVGQLWADCPNGYRVTKVVTAWRGWRGAHVVCVSLDTQLNSLDGFLVL